MYPVLFTWGDFSIPSWHFFYLLGALLTLFFAIRVDRRFGSPIGSSEINRLFLIAYISGYLGARGLSLVVEEHFEFTSINFWQALATLGGLTFYGGFLLATFSVTAYLLWRRLPIWSALDICAPAIFLGLVVGRIGCFLNGCCYGHAMTVGTGGAPSIWSVRFSVLQDDVYRYPTQLIESFAVLLLLLMIYVMSRHFFNGKRGVIGLATVIGYAALRFFIEFLRADNRGWAISEVLSTSQFISLLLILLLLPMLIQRLKYSKNDNLS